MNSQNPSTARQEGQTQDTQQSALTASRTGSFLINNIIVSLLVVEMILTGTVFKSAQIIVELALIAILAFMVARLKVSRIDLVLLVALFATQIISLILNDIVTFMLNAKLFAISIFVFIYFKHTYFKTKLIDIVFFINLIIVIHQLLSGAFIFNNAWFLGGGWAEVGTSRPLGVFVNTHLTAGFVAVYLIYLSNMRRLYFLDFLLLYYIYSLFNIVAYSCQIIANIKIFKYILEKINPFFIIVLIVLTVFAMGDYLMDFATSWGLRELSLRIMIDQITNPEFYKGILTLYPVSYKDFLSAQTDSSLGLGNEMELISIFVKGGLVLASVLLVAFIKHLKHFQVFIFVTLFHYGYLVTAPLILYMMMTYNHEIEVKKNGMLNC